MRIEKCQCGDDVCNTYHLSIARSNGGLDKEDAERVLSLWTALTGIEDPEGFIELVSDTLKEGNCPYYTGDSDCQTHGKICSYCQLKALFPPTKAADDD